MLRRLFSVGAAHAAAATTKSDEDSRCEKKSKREEEEVAASLDFAQIVSQLEDFEGEASPPLSGACYPDGLSLTGSLCRT